MSGKIFDMGRTLSIMDSARRMDAACRVDAAGGWRVVQGGPLLAFTCSMYRPGPCRRGCCGDDSVTRSALVVANTKAEALGLLLEQYADSSADEWKMEPVDLTKPGVIDLDLDC